MAWPADWDRASVRGAIEEASGVSLSVGDELPDTLIAKAQELGLRPIDLKLWIYDSPKPGWTPAALTDWARRNGLTTAEREGEQMEMERKENGKVPEGIGIHAVTDARPKQCPFYGRGMSFGEIGSRRFATFVQESGNRCALITSSFSPCAMEIAGGQPRWELCLRNPDNNGTGAA